MKNISIILLLTGIIISSCQPYEDGPKISLKSADSRFQQTWVLSKIVNSDGTEITPTTSSYYEFKENGILIITTGGDVFEANWEITDKTKLKLSYSEIGFDEFEIKRLSSKDLWLEEKAGLYVNKFISKN
ncbi:MAG: hypothetical protein JXR58_07540 [Bacteroidales bacterium]|nr:hypothetical protein [Bacteroidales bacterium]